MMSRRSLDRIHLTWVVLAAVAAAAVVVFARQSQYFLSADNLANVLADVSVAGIVAVPATFLMMTGCVDLSVGAAAAFGGIVLAALTPGLGLTWAIVLVALAGLLIGLGNGLLVTTLGLDSVLITFAVMGLLRALAYLIPSGLAVVVPGFRSLADARPIPGVPLPALIFAAVVLAGVWASHSQVGRRVRELGRSPEPGRRRTLVLLLLFVISALAAALAGLIRTSQLSTGLPTAATGLEITVVVSVVLGGGRLSGGHSSIVGTLLALATVSIIDNGLSLLNVTSYVNQVFHAALLLLALVVGRPRARRT